MAKTGFHPLRRAIQWHGFATNVDLSKRAIGSWPRRQAIEQEQVPISGRQVGQGDALGDDFVVQPSAVPQLRPSQYHRRAVGQRRVELLDKTVEIQGSELQYAIILGQARIVGGHPRKLGQRRMIDGHAFGFAGGTGGVDHVGQVVLVNLDLRVVLAVVDQTRIRHVQRRHAFWQRHRHMGLRQYHTHTAVLQHMQQAFARVLRVQRHIGAAGLEHGQQANHHLERALDRHTHPHFRADTACDQRMRQAIGLAVQLGITDGVFVQAQGNRLRALLHLGLEQPVNACRRFEHGATLVPGVQHIALFCIDQHGQLRHTGVRTPDNGAQQALPMLGHALHGGRFEQVSGVGQRRPDTLRGLLSIQAEVELCTLAAPLQCLNGQARQLQLATGLMRFSLVVEHHLEQRVMAQAALRLQCLDQLLERQILMTLGLECALLDLGQQLTEGHLPVDIGLEHLGIDEEADKALGFCAIAVGDRHTDANIRLPAVAIQQRLEGRQQQHEQRHTFALSQRLEAADQHCVQVHVQTRAAITLYRRARMIQGQLQYRLLTAQPLNPVTQLALFFAGFHPTALPQGIVGVLNRQLRQAHILALAEAHVQLHQLIDHDLHRPAVGDNVVQHQHQYMLIRRHLQ
ncbi:hypothetical protein [Pseudomonas sp. 58 R 3]|nr:hypothetical protein [Pseudomonas sp. 58 R 3]